MYSLFQHHAINQYCRSAGFEAERHNQVVDNDLLSPKDTFLSSTKYIIPQGLI
jgi:hypothetical protein